MRTVTLLVVALALTAASAAAARDPYADVSTMRLAFSHVRSVVAVERFSSGEVATVEFASPNRFHITMPQSQIMLAGNVEYTKSVNGGWKRSAHGAQHQALLNASWYLAGPTDIDIHKLFTITSLGTKRTDHASVRGYMLHDTAGAYNEIVWIGPNYLPVAASIEMPDQTIKIHYVAYNSPTMLAMPNVRYGHSGDVSMNWR